MILVERLISSHYEYAIKLCTHHLDLYARLLKLATFQHEAVIFFEIEVLTLYLLFLDIT